MVLDEDGFCVIEHLGKTYKTKRYTEITDELWKELQQQYFEKPELDDVKNQMKKFHCGGKKNNHITNYYVFDLMCKTIINGSKWSIEQVMQSKDLVAHFVAVVESNEKVFDEGTPLVKNLKTAMRIGGGGVASKPANFPVDTCRNILQKYNINNNYYDPSCGWGARLSCAMSLGINYYGTDPNTLLVPRLKDLAQTYKEVNNIDTETKIMCQGSENMIDELVGKMGICFTSPPYFFLEDYQVGEQSWSDGVSYDDWLNDFMVPTLINCYYYLVEGGVCAINIKNIKGYPMYDDCYAILDALGMEFVTHEHLKNITRVVKSGKVDNDESIAIFRKNSEFSGSNPNIDNYVAPKQKKTKKQKENVIAKEAISAVKIALQKSVSLADLMPKLMVDNWWRY